MEFIVLTGAVNHSCYHILHLFTFYNKSKFILIIVFEDISMILVLNEGITNKFLKPKNFQNST